MSQDDLLSNQQSIGALSMVHMTDNELHRNAANMMTPPPPPPPPRRPGPMRLNTISASLGDGDPLPGNMTPLSLSPTQSPPLSPSMLRQGPRHAALRRAALILRASRSTASLQGVQSWPPAPPSRSQSLNLHPPCSCNCGASNVPSFANNNSPSTNPEHVPESQPDGSLTAVGLSWRRLHISRAKLKATATTSELLSGFAMVAMVELQINEGTKVPEWLFVLFSVCTTVLVAVHIFALMISTYILPNIDAISRLHASELVVESPHERMRWFIELAWGFSTVLGLFLFLVEVAILCWVKFWDYSFTAALASTAIVVPSLALFVGFAVHFYHTLVVHKCEASDVDLKQLEAMRQKLDQAVPIKKDEKIYPPGYNNV